MKLHFYDLSNGQSYVELINDFEVINKLYSKTFIENNIHCNRKDNIVHIEMTTPKGNTIADLIKNKDENSEVIKKLGKLREKIINEKPKLVRENISADNLFYEDGKLFLKDY